ncbi:Fertility inhibition FinO [Variovorax sp. KBW07]|uniref:ProQ/FINO family protein n=1 Tax=Variovorax sp. KBW07 TaxID=2153358 RepID=UPI000F578250|nr:ProQ/FINO family protein [Variovorax sp. KBW07]RQO36915.1 Fertility inhibition FinO [Variovorax sp. KBW07]
MTDTATPQETQEVREVKEDTGNDTQQAQQAEQQQQQPEQQQAPQQPRAGKGRSQRGGGGQQQQRSQKAKQPQGQQQQQQQRPQRKVHPALEKLFALYPKMFGAHFLPLKLGVYQDLLAQHPDEFKKEDLKVALGLHARSTRYLEAVAAGHQRHDLQGVPVEPVAPEHVHHAILEVFKRRQARSNEDLRPHVVTRIIAAIEASGLGRDAYAERVRTQDETNNALLDEAVAELGRQAAKREALFRAFTASGRSEAEFAEMYGMDPDEVARTLARVRADQVQAEAAAAAAAAAATTVSSEEAGASGDATAS